VHKLAIENLWIVFCQLYSITMFQWWKTHPSYYLRNPLKKGDDFIKENLRLNLFSKIWSSHPTHQTNFPDPPTLLHYHSEKHSAMIPAGWWCVRTPPAGRTGVQACDALRFGNRT
jgi:hypothetical protein